MVTDMNAWLNDIALPQHEVLQMNQEGLVISQGGWVGFVVG